MARCGPVFSLVIPAKSGNEVIQRKSELCDGIFLNQKAPIQAIHLYARGSSCFREAVGDQGPRVRPSGAGSAVGSRKTNHEGSLSQEWGAGVGRLAIFPSQ
ncbi:hypothetical protein E4U61_002400 [Claviceps capensis]|nr:hypothetical protein E4U61_002400 [Claviceps capensis]